MDCEDASDRVGLSHAVSSYRLRHVHCKSRSWGSEAHRLKQEDLSVSLKQYLEEALAWEEGEEPLDWWAAKQRSWQWIVTRMRRGSM